VLHPRSRVVAALLQLQAALKLSSSRCDYGLQLHRLQALLVDDYFSINAHQTHLHVAIVCHHSLRAVRVWALIPQMPLCASCEDGTLHVVMTKPAALPQVHLTCLV